MDRLRHTDFGRRVEKPWARMAVAALAVCVIVPLIGCNAPGVHPWRDDSIPPSAYGSATSEVILEAGEEPAIRVLDVPPTQALRVRDTVPHWPLWWEDPFEDQGDKDGQFAWTWQDYFNMPYAPARFMLNTVAFPVSAIVTLPGTPMVSDGRVDNTHDAQRGRSPDPVAGPEDFMAEPFEESPGTLENELSAAPEPLAAG
jgi:hypothetical protein